MRSLAYHRAQTQFKVRNGAAGGVGRGKSGLRALELGREKGVMGRVVGMPGLVRGGGRERGVGAVHASTSNDCG